MDWRFYINQIFHCLPLLRSYVMILNYTPCNKVAEGIIFLTCLSVIPVLVIATPLKQHNRISWNFVYNIKNILCKCAYTNVHVYRQEITIHFFPMSYAPLSLHVHVFASIYCCNRLSLHWTPLNTYNRIYETLWLMRTYNCNMLMCISSRNFLSVDICRVITISLWT